MKVPKLKGTFGVFKKGFVEVSHAENQICSKLLKNVCRILIFFVRALSVLKMGRDKFAPHPSGKFKVARGLACLI